MATPLNTSIPVHFSEAYVGVLWGLRMIQVSRFACEDHRVSCMKQKGSIPFEGCLWRTTRRGRLHVVQQQLSQQPISTFSLYDLAWGFRKKKRAE